MNNLDFDDLLNLIFKWNIDFPIDRWWRKTHSIAFNSSCHRNITFIDMFIEWQEENLYQEVKREKEKYTPGEGNYIYKQEQEIVLPEDFFNNIDLDQI